MQYLHIDIFVYNETISEVGVVEIMTVYKMLIYHTVTFCECSTTENDVFIDAISH